MANAQGRGFGGGCGVAYARSRLSGDHAAPRTSDAMTSVLPVGMLVIKYSLRLLPLRLIWYMNQSPAGDKTPPSTRPSSGVIANPESAFIRPALASSG